MDAKVNTSKCLECKRNWAERPQTTNQQAACGKVCPSPYSALVALVIVPHLKRDHRQNVVRAGLLTPHLGLGPLSCRKHHLPMRTRLGREHWRPWHAHRLHHGHVSSHWLHHRTVVWWTWRHEKRDANESDSVVATAITAVWKLDSVPGATSR